MKIISILMISILTISCTNKNEKRVAVSNEEITNKVQKQEFQVIIDSANVYGAILIFDAQKELYYSNNFKWCKKGKLPASTFKIPNSIIALETSIVENDSTLFRWDGEKRALKNWEQDLTFKQAFHFSCVPCYQEIAREIGLERMKEYIEKFNYGEIKVNSTSIDNFWLVGQSQINQFQQIDFLRRFHNSELPIKNRTEKIMKELMVIENNEAYKLSGKTGWSIRGENNNGWFVGYIESKEELYYFATNVEPKEKLDMKLFPKIRKDVTYQALQEMKIIN